MTSIFRDHLKLAKVERGELTTSTRTTVEANFRSWRDSGLTWLAMNGLDVARIQRRAGHETISTTMGYVKQAEDLTADLGAPFMALPDSLVKPNGQDPEPTEGGSNGPTEAGLGTTSDRLDARDGRHPRADESTPTSDASVRDAVRVGVSVRNPSGPE